MDAVELAPTPFWLSNLVEAARMFEASCRLGGKDQEFAQRNLDEAEARALAQQTSPVWGDGVTEAMIEAGVEAWDAFGISETVETTLTRVYRAMQAARLTSTTRTDR